MGRRRLVQIGAEAATLFAILLGIDHGLLAGRAFDGVQPNPYWVPTILLALAYGTGPGLAAAAIASAIWLLAPHNRPDGADELEAMLGQSLLPMLWVIFALVIGEVTAGRRATIEEQARREEDLERKQQRIAETLADLSDINHALQVRIATEYLTVGDAIDAAIGLLEQDPQLQIEAVERLIALAAQTDDFTFFEVHGHRAVARFRGRGAGNRPSDLSRAGLARSLTACPLLRHDGTLADVVAQPDGLSLQVRTGEGGRLTGLLLIHSLPQSGLTEAKIAELSHVASSIGKLPALLAADEPALAAAEWPVVEGQLA